MAAPRADISSIDMEKHIFTWSAMAVLINTKRRSPTANLLAIACARLNTIAKDVRVWFPGCIVVFIVAVALAGILQSCKAVTLTLTILQALRYGHCIGGGGGPLECSCDDTVIRATDIFPAQGLHLICEKCLRLANGGHRASWWRCVLWTIGDGIATGELGQIARYWFVDGWRDHASLGLLVAVQVGKNRAVRELTAVVRASIDGSLQCFDIPPVYKIAMKTVAGPVSHCEDEWMMVGVVPAVGKKIGLVDDFIEYGDKTHWVGVRAPAIVVCVVADRICHVCAVVCVVILAVPTGGEIDLRAEAIGAVDVGHSERLGRYAIIVKADEAHSFAGSSIGAGLVALEWVSRQHAEARWERLQLFGTIATLLVVYS